MYIADFGANLVRKITISTGIITSVAGTGTYEFSGDGGQATSAGLYNPAGVAVDSSGNIYIADYSNYRIRKVTASTSVITTIAGSDASSFLGDEGAATAANIFDPHAVAVDISGNIYIADFYNHRIRKVTVSTGIITTYAGTGTCEYTGDGGVATSATLCKPSDLDFDASGNLYIAEVENCVIRKVTFSTDIISRVAGVVGDDYNGDGGPGTLAGLNEPNGVALDSSGKPTTCFQHVITE